MVTSSNMIGALHYIEKYTQRTTSALPLVTFRILFGLLIFAGIVRFWSMGWIHELYIAPRYFFPYFGLEFIKPLGELTYVIFIICAISSLFVALGFFYRVSAVTLFLSFTYIELMDKSTYLNHYYFVSLAAFLLIFIPAHCCYSVDAFRRRHIFYSVPQWTVDSIKLLIVLVYLFAGLAKVNSDWILHALPLKIWLPAKNDIPVIGDIFNLPQTAFIFSWFGCLYDLAIPFLLLKQSTRVYAFVFVLTFHVVTAILFPIGMFPYIMIACVVIFFSEEYHQPVLNFICTHLKLKKITSAASHYDVYRFNGWQKPVLFILALFFIVQIIVPFRHLMYPGELFWTEQGYRFSWRVMLVEKAGSAEFTVQDDKKKLLVDNREFLTPLQEKMMSTQPDMIVQYSHMLYDHYSKEGFNNPQIFVDSYVALNGRLGTALISSTVDLAKVNDSFKHKRWIEPFKDEISGF